MTEAERDLIRRQSDCIAQQTREIEALRAEVDRLGRILADEGDALAHLRRLYSDPSSSVATVLRAAAEAAPYERAKAPQLNQFSVLIDDLSARLAARRKGEDVRIIDGRLVDEPDDEGDTAD
jgi:hypothetical protein